MHCRFPSENAPLSARSGMTLIEILVGIVLMAMVAAALSAMTQHSLQAFSSVDRVNHSQQLINAIQRQVSNYCGRIQHSEEFSGIRVVEMASGQTGLALWIEKTALQPQKNQIAFLTSDPTKPNQLCWFQSIDNEAISGTDPDTVWNQFFEVTVSDLNSDRIKITDQLATSAIVPGGSVQSWELERMPSDTNVQNYRNGLVSWADLPWPQDLYTESTGVQRHLVRGRICIVDKAGFQIPVFLSCHSTLTLTK